MELILAVVFSRCMLGGSLFIGNDLISRVRGPIGGGAVSFVAHVGVCKHVICVCVCVLECLYFSSFLSGQRKLKQLDGL